jgi:NAD(P)-dependent dehydrogenase (short-subunit alcohol dehydrogenase family)
VLLRPLGRDREMSGHLTDKRVMVTGAERGIGRALAVGLAREGADVVIVYYQALDLAQGVVEEIEALGRRAIAIQADVSISHQVTSAVARACDAFGGLDVLVNNAAVLYRQPFLEIPEEDFDRVLAVNARGTFLVSQTVARRMVEAGTGGTIINISSISATRAAPGLVHYQASKAAITMLTKGMALELAGHGIRVNAVAPALTITDLNRDLMADPEIRAERVAAVPLGRPGEPQDHVGAVVYLASDASRWVTGATITVDGGVTVR